jgi:hypothetical protein
MALTKATIIDRIEIMSDGVIFVRTVTRAFDDDGSVLGERIVRTTLTPGQDVTAQPAKVRAICNLVWTPAVVAAYQAAVAAAKVNG